MSGGVRTIATYQMVTVYMEDGSSAECSECEHWRNTLKKKFATEVLPQYPMFFFNRIKVKTESEGRGSALMKALTVTLDEHKIAVVCTVQPYVSGRMDADELEKWYEKYGFETIKDSKGLMLRLPKEVKNVRHSKVP